MINVTVKTLDSQNHQFTVDDGFTVEQFKNHIADTVNVPAARQRIIYCGRVLQDNSKLADYDVDGKVVHLVQRAPPNPGNRNVRSLTPPPDLNRARGGFRGFDRVGNTVYMGMGSMTFPQGVIEPQQMFPPRATHTLSSSRLNVARRMLRNAENVIRQLENPSGANEPPPQADEPVEEEMTPVIEARVIVPSNGDQPIDGNAILNAVQNTIFPAVGNLDPSIGPSTSTGSAEAPGGQQSSTSTPRSSSTENLNADTTSDTPRDGSRQSRLRCRGTEMATLLDTLNQLQGRFSPFLARYQAFMQDDPQVAPDNLQETRQMLNRVSQVLHYLGHAYHSLSDIIINVDQPPPRLLLCRPILIQPPVVQTGIPIQVEAQINLSTDRPGSTPSSTSTASTGATTNSNAPDSTSTVNSSSSSSASAEQSQSQSGGPGITLQPGFVGLPFMPTSSMRVITTPVEIRTLRPNASSRPTNNNNNTSASASSTAQSAPSAPASTTVGAENSQPPQNEPGQTQNQGPPTGHVVTNNGNLEFFMEVTPEALRGGNLIQSLMQLVGSQLGDTLAQAQNQRSENPIQSNQTSTTQGESQQSQARSTQTNPTTSTHTRSTPRPHVYMTQQAVQGGFDPFLHCYSHHVTQSRPQRIVSVDPQANRAEPSATRESTGPAANAPNSQTSENAGGTGGAPPNMPNVNAQFEDIIRGLPQSFVDIPNVFNSRQTAELVANAVTQALRQHIFPTGQGPPSAQQQRPPPAPQQRPLQAHQGPPTTQQAPPPAHQGSPSPAAPQVPPPRGAPDGQSPLNQNNWQGRSQQDIFGFVGRLMEQNLPDSLRRGPTLDVYVQSFHPEPYVQGESLIIDLIMLMLRNLRINDLFMISSGNMAPLQRQIDTIQGFFLTEICQNDTTDAGIARASERVMNDFRPIISALESIPARENIDMARTIEGFFRQRVTEIIRLAINSRARMEGNSEQNESDLLTTIWRTSRELLALAVHCSANGQEGVEAVCVDVMSSTIFNQSNVPNDLHNWTITSSRAALRTFFQNLDIRTSEIEQYVVRNVPQGASQSETESMQQESSCEAVVAGNNVEAMDVDFESPVSTEPLLAAPIMVEDTEPLPHVIWGSEPWHRHTPENWVPIITRDINKQRRQSSQQPFSDAYLSGMPSKRRKLINNSKPQGSLPQVIAESVRQAVTSTGLASVAPLDVVAQAASESAEIQTAYRNLLQSTVRTSLRDNEDFNPERYPNTARYFYESSPE